MNWPTVQIRYVAKTGTGHTPSRSRPELWNEPERVIPWITLADVGQLRSGTVDVLTDTAERITPAGVAASSAVVHPAGTVVLSRTASVGFSAIMGRDMAVSQDFMTWTPGPRLYGRFLLYVLRGSRPALLGLMHGSTHKTIYMPDLLALRTPLPPIDDQVRIAAFLDRECVRIQALQRRLGAFSACLEEERSARLEPQCFPCPGDSYWFGDLPSGWTAAPIGSLGSLADGDWIETPFLTDSGIRLIQTGNIGRGVFRGDSARYISSKTCIQLNCNAVEAGDVLFSRLNTPIGRACLAPQLDGGMIASVDVSILRTRGVNARWLIAVASTDRWLGWLGQLARGTTMLRVARSQLARVRVPVPPTNVQDSIASDFANLQREAVRNEGALSRVSARLTQYRDALITDVVTGQLDVTKLSASQLNESAHAAAEGEHPEVLTA